MVYLIAGDYRQALHFAREKGLGEPNKTWKYVSKEHDLQGLRNPVIIRLGSWHLNSNIDDILDFVHERNFEILDSKW